MILTSSLSQGVLPSHDKSPATGRGTCYCCAQAKRAEMPGHPEAQNGRTVEADGLARQACVAQTKYPATGH
jgi:hypothetical protein